MKIRVPLQFFADSSDDDKNKNSQGNDGQNDGGQQNDGQNKSGSDDDSANGKKSEEKTFSQDQVSKMMAKEKNQGRNAHISITH